MTSSANVKSLTTLHTTLASTKALVQQFEISIQNGIQPGRELPLNPPNPLAVLSDAAKILSAQTTKLSLLVLNKPFTPSEITFILKSLSQECLPALVAAAELCPAEEYSRLLHRWIRSSVSSTLKELLNLFNEIPTDERGVEKTRGRNTLASTGVIWDCCNTIVKFSETGITALATVKVESYHSLLKDAIEELEEWQTGEMDDDDDDDDDSDSDDMVAQKILPSDFQSMHLSHKNPARNEPPTTNPTTNTAANPFAAPLAHTPSSKPLSDRVLKTLRLISLLFPALIKRRIKRFPAITSSTKPADLPTTEQLDTMDDLITYCQLFSEEADELAGALYAHDEGEVDERIGVMKGYARKCLARVRGTWEGGEDEFSEWVGKWLVKLDEI